MSLNKDMGDAHEGYLADLFNGRQSRGSGNQWRNPMDGRTSRRHLAFAFAWDGKSTLSKSISVTRDMIAKAREQAGGERPMLGLRFYRDEKLRVESDWVAVQAEDMAEVLQEAERAKMLEKALQDVRRSLVKAMEQDFSKVAYSGEAAAIVTEIDEALS